MKISFLRYILFVISVGLLLAALSLYLGYRYLADPLPPTETLRQTELQVPLKVYAKDGALIGVFGEKRRSPVPLSEIPDQLKQAVLAAEDARFYEHPGVDYEGVTRAIWHIIKTGEKGPGGSTITQQLTRDLFLSREKTYVRKLREMILAIRFEEELSKDEILELYLNKTFFGHRAYGAAAAAEVYYGKALNELTLAEAAMIAGLPQAPSRVNPISNPARAIERRNYVLRRMQEVGFISGEEYDQALNAEDFAFPHEPAVELEAPYVAEMVRQWMYDRYGEDAYTAGFEVVAEIEPRLQRAANHSLRDGLRAYDRRHGFRGPEATLDESALSDDAAIREALSATVAVAGLQPAAVVSVDEAAAILQLSAGQTITLDFADVQWAKPYRSENATGPAPTTITDVLNPGDVIRVERDEAGEWTMSQLPAIQGALVALDPKSGAIQALVGGFAFEQSKFNRATQAERQPGSSFKPIIYSAALDNGFTTSSLVNDAPIVFRYGGGKVWRPQNFSGKFYGPTRVREGLIHSRNLVSIRLLKDMGLRSGYEHALRFGFRQDTLPRDLSVALGSASVTPLEMARAYSAFANRGRLADIGLIRSVHQNGQGVIIEEATEERAEIATVMEDDDDQSLPLEPGQVITEANAYLINSLLQDVIQRGTARRALELGRSDLAGKTGTTNDHRDAWFVGYNPTLVTAVWVGFDDLAPLGAGEVGGRAALPIWMDFMKTALEGVSEQSIPMPETIITARIDTETGQLASAGQSGTTMEIFERGHMPDASLDYDDIDIGQEVVDIRDLYEVF